MTKDELLARIGQVEAALRREQQQTDEALQAAQHELDEIRTEVEAMSDDGGSSELKLRLATVEAAVEALGTRIGGVEDAHRSLASAVADLTGRVDQLEASPLPPCEPFPGDGDDGEEPPLPPEPKPPAEGRPERPDFSGAVEINPGLSHGEVAQALAKHSRILFAPGTYNGLSIRPRDGQAFLARDGDNSARLDGRRQNIRALHGGAKGVYWEGIDVTGYSSGLDPNGNFDQRDHRGQIAAIHPDDSDGDGPARDWTIVGANVDDNDCRGITACPGMVVSHGSVSDNLGMTGIGGSASYGQLFQHLAVAGNNRSGRFNRHHDSGGIKLTGGGRTPSGRGPKPLAVAPVFRHIISFGNLGPGLWLDWDISDALFEDCFVVGNERGGLILECCAHTTVRRCVFVDNVTVGQDNSVMSFNGGIGIQNSKKTLVEACDFWVSNGYAIYLQYQCRPAAVRTPMASVGIGYFTGTENRVLGNNRVRVLAGGRGVYGQSLTDEPVAWNENRDCNGIFGAGVLTDTSETQSRMTPHGGPGAYPADSNRKRRPDSNDYCFVPRMKGPALFNEFAEMGRLDQKPELP